MTRSVGVEKVGAFSGVLGAEVCTRGAGYRSFPHLSSGRYRGSGRPAQESDQSFDVLGGGRQEELLSDELQPAQAQATKTDVTL